VLAILTLASAGFGAAQPQARIPVLAELFTSEGCSSCPPADELLEHLLQEQPIEGVYVVPLSEHVTYWDHQGWKDPFSTQQFTTRQQQYGLRFNLDSIYTPQLVIDGAREFVGSDRRSIERAFHDAGSKTKPELKVSVTNSGAALTIAASGAGLTVEPDAELWFAVTEDRLSINVKRGENANRTMKHSGVVRVLRSAGNARQAAQATITLDPGWRRDHLRVVAFVQSRKDRRVLSVGLTRVARDCRLRPT
jgi:hypothetical protein